MRRFGGVLLFLALMMAMLAGCGTAGGSASSGTSASSPPMGAPAAPAPASTPAASTAASPKAADSTAGGGAAKASTPAVDSRKLIYTADVSLEVSNMEDSLQKLQALAGFERGYVSDLNKSGTAESGFNGRITLRVPTEQFDEAMGKLKGFATKVTGERRNVADVTDKYVDLSARLKSAQEHEVRLQALVQKAGSLDELLKLENELERVRSEIEGLQGTMNVLGSQIAFSTINVTLTQLAPEKRPEPMVKTGLGKRLADAWQTSVVTLEDFVTGLLVIITTLLLPVGSLALVAGLIVWVVRQVQARRKPSATPPANPPQD